MIVHDEVIEARAAWAHPIRAGERLRIIDIGGNQAVDFLVYNSHDTSERYSAPDTIVAQGNIFLVAGSRLVSGDGNPMMMFMTGKIKAKGDLGLAANVAKLFDIPKA